jgi:hypothetical protein
LIPKDLLPDRIAGVNLRDVRRALPPEIRVPITGTLNKIQIDPVKAVLSNVPGLNLLQPGSGNQNPLENLGGFLEQLQGNRPREPAEPPPSRGRGQ